MAKFKKGFFTLLSGLLFTILLCWGCKPENEVVNKNQQRLEQTRKSMNDFSEKSTEYRHFPIEVGFFDPVADRNNPHVAMQSRMDFIKQSGLPDESNIDDFKKNKSVSFALGLYQDHINRNIDHPYLKTFEQYGAWLILTRLDLLAHTSSSDLQMIYILLEKLASSRHEGYQLMHYGIRHLYENNYEAARVRRLASSVLEYANIPASTKQGTDQPASGGEHEKQSKLPQEILNSVKNYSMNKEQNRQRALQEIQELLNRI